MSNSDAEWAAFLLGLAIGSLFWLGVMLWL